MKKIFLFSILVFAFCFSKAQGNLQFNQVIFYDVASLGTQATVVPAGKVWKIESVGSGGGNNTIFYLRNSSLQNIISMGNPSIASNAPLPFWLPSGFTGSLQNPSPNRSCISIIEFNVVP